MKQLKVLLFLLTAGTCFFLACSESKTIEPKNENIQPLKSTVYDVTSVEGVLNYMDSNFLDGSGDPPSGEIVKARGHFWGDLDGDWGCNYSSEDVVCVIAYIYDDHIDIKSYGILKADYNYDPDDGSIYKDFIVGVGASEPILIQCDIHSYTVDSVGDLATIDFTPQP